MWKVLNVSVLERYSCKESDGDLVGGIFVDDGDICFKHASRAGDEGFFLGDHPRIMFVAVIGIKSKIVSNGVGHDFI